MPRRIKIEWSNTQYFLDGIILAVDFMNDMMFWIQKVFNRLAYFNLSLDPTKLQLCKENITYLGFNLNKNGYLPSPDSANKIKKISNSN